MNTQTAKTVRFHETGDASVLKLEEHKLAEPGPGEIRIRVEAIGLNRAEIMFREGKYLEMPEFPSKLGYEASGVIDALGNGVVTFALDKEPTPFPLFAALGKGLTLRGYTIFETSTDPERLKRATDYINARLESGALQPLIDRVFPLSEIREAHEYMASNLQMGKIVVTVLTLTAA